MAAPAPVHPPFGTVLVANRGEIACRVIRTLRRLGVRSVAVFSDADAGARHVREADVAVRLGPAEARRSYLDVDAVLAAAKATGADAIHPGYGFLAENPALARACEAAGVVFVGPGVRALDLMGDKIRAKEHVAATGVPVVPGVSGLPDEELPAAVADIGLPVLLKPSAGGGGKGMTVVERAEDLPDALAAARRVAAAAFGDDTLLVERFVPRPRHVEVQVLADTHGAVVHLGERECSLQRRHQKVVEEAPSPALDDAARARIGELACEVARSVDYVGAGTVEFLVPADDPAQAWFMEMNTRLQVEHPVTEMVTGLDLVEWQLRVAAGEPLGLTQDDVVVRGHAVEARVYAEDPARDFLPTTGTVLALEEPSGEGLRVDSALLDGLEVGAAYDPMLAKVVAWAPDRAEALRRLDGALARTVVLGVRTNVAFLRTLLADDDVRAGRLDTGLLERLLPFEAPPGREALVACALHQLSTTAEDATAAWRRDGWRLGGPAPRRVVLDTGGRTVRATVEGTPSAATVTLDDDAPVHASLHVLDDGIATVTVDGVAHHVRLADEPGPAHEHGLGAAPGRVVWVGVDGDAHRVRVVPWLEDLARRHVREGSAEGAAHPEVRSPMPGTVVSVDVSDGEHVLAGRTLLTVEAMKMEHRIAAPTDGVVALSVRPADRVSLDQVVATVTPHPTQNPHEGTP